MGVRRQVPERWQAEPSKFQLLPTAASTAVFVNWGLLAESRFFIHTIGQGRVESYERGKIKHYGPSSYRHEK